MDAAWIDAWDRLGRANARAHRERLRRLTIEEAIRQFEQLCRELSAMDPALEARTHAVGHGRFWREREP